MCYITEWFMTNDWSFNVNNQVLSTLSLYGENVRLNIDRLLNINRQAFSSKNKVKVGYLIWKYVLLCWLQISKFVNVMRECSWWRWQLLTHRGLSRDFAAVDHLIFVWQHLQPHAVKRNRLIAVYWTLWLQVIPMY